MPALLRTLLGVLLLCTAHTLGAQVPDPRVAGDTLRIDSIQDYRRLFRFRESVIAEMDRIGPRLAELQERTRFPMDTLRIRSDSVRFARELESARASPQADTSLVARLESTVQSVNQTLREARTLPGERDYLMDRHQLLNVRLVEVEQRIASLYDASRDLNAFRSTVTRTFGLLVFFVIVGFYLIAWYKGDVATTIFSGEMGMQFVTLFLIVIAIILFGIMGTLEGRELAALLGGLSGYILGRQSGRDTARGEVLQQPGGKEGDVRK